MGDPEKKVDPCKTEPCKSALADYELKMKALSDAVDATKNLLNNPPRQQGLGWAIGGAVLAGLGIVFIATGVGAVAGAVCIAGGAACAYASAKTIADWNNSLAKARDDCANAHNAFRLAKNKVVLDRPSQCWPHPFADFTCP